MPDLIEYVPAPVFAREIGRSPATVARWRRQGKGPKGWIHLYGNQVVYPKGEVDAFKAREAERIRVAAQLDEAKSA